MIFRKANRNDAELLAASMKKIHSDMDDPSMYVIDEAEELEKYIDGEHGFALLAEEKNMLAGYFVFRFPDINEPEALR